MLILSIERTCQTSNKVRDFPILKLTLKYFKIEKYKKLYYSLFPFKIEPDKVTKDLIIVKACWTVKRMLSRRIFSAPQYPHPVPL